MNKTLYSKILNSIDKEIKSIINEQFNVSDLNFSDDEQEYDANIFNKNIIDIEKIVKDILNYNKLSDDVINDLNDDLYISIYKVKSKQQL